MRIRIILFIGTCTLGLQGVWTPASKRELIKILMTASSQRQRVSVGGLMGDASNSGDEVNVSLQKLNRVLSFDRVSNRVTVQGGMSLKVLKTFLTRRGVNMSCIFGGNITVAEALGTELRAFVEKIQLISMHGEVRSVSRRDSADVFEEACLRSGRDEILYAATMRSYVPLFLALPSQSPLLRLRQREQSMQHDMARWTEGIKYAPLSVGYKREVAYRLACLKHCPGIAHLERLVQTGVGSLIHSVCLSCGGQSSKEELTIVQKSIDLEKAWNSIVDAYTMMDYNAYMQKIEQVFDLNGQIWAYIKTHNMPVMQDNDIDAALRQYLCDTLSGVFAGAL